MMAYAAVGAFGRGHRWSWIVDGVPCIVLVDNSSHWCVVAGTLGSRICVVDSADGGLLSCLEPDAFLARWECKGEKKPYYAIAVVAKKEPA